MGFKQTSDPTLEEIERLCEEIRSKWTKEQRLQRLGFKLCRRPQKSPPKIYPASSLNLQPDTFEPPIFGQAVVKENKV